MTTRRVPAQRSMNTSAGVCEYCGCALGEGAGVDVVVPDSGYLHRDDSRHDGNRPARVCSSRHARELIADGNRQWVDEQFWANKLRRVAGYWKRADTTVDGFAGRAGLTRSQLARAVHWQRARPARGVGNGRDDRAVSASALGGLGDAVNQRERDELAEYVELIADEYERARHVLDRFPRVYEDQLDEVRHGDDTPDEQVSDKGHE